MEVSKGINNVCHPRKGEECSELKTNHFVKRQPETGQSSKT